MNVLYYFLLISVSLFTMEYLLRKGFTEKSVVATSLSVILWTITFVIVNNIYLFIATGFALATFTELFLISKLYPTLNSRLFTKEKKNAVQRSVPGSKEDSKDIQQNKDRNISEDHR